MRKLILSLSLFITFRAYAQDALKYQTPPESIMELAMAAPSPQTNFSSKGDVMLVMDRTSYPTIEELSQNGRMADEICKALVFLSYSV